MKIKFRSLTSSVQIANQFSSDPQPVQFRSLISSVQIANLTTTADGTAATRPNIANNFRKMASDTNLANQCLDLTRLLVNCGHVFKINVRAGFLYYFASSSSLQGGENSTVMKKKTGNHLLQ